MANEQRATGSTHEARMMFVQPKSRTSTVFRDEFTQHSQV